MDVWHCENGSLSSETLLDLAEYADFWKSIVRVETAETEGYFQCNDLDVTSADLLEQGTCVLFTAEGVRVVRSQTAIEASIRRQNEEFVLHRAAATVQTADGTAPPRQEDAAHGMPAASHLAAGLAAAAVVCAMGGAAARRTSAQGSAAAHGVSATEPGTSSEVGAAPPPPPVPHATLRRALPRAGQCLCDHGGQGCRFAARPGPYERCLDCSFRAVEVLGRDAQGCSCGCRCPCDICAGAESGHRSLAQNSLEDAGDAEDFGGIAYFWNSADMTFYPAASGDAAAPAGAAAAPVAAAAASGLQCSCICRPTGTAGAGTRCLAMAPLGIAAASSGWRCRPCGGGFGAATASSCWCSCAGCEPASPVDGCLARVLDVCD